MSKEQQPKEQEFLVAAKLGKLTTMERLITEGVDINTAGGSNNYTALHYAAGNGDPEKCTRLLDLLLDNGANANQRAKGGMLPLHIAAAEDNLQAMRSLINRGVDVDRVSDGDGSALIYAIACNGKYETIKCLLDSGANVNHSNNNGLTPLHLSVKNLDASVTQLLLDRGADLEAIDNEGRRPIDIAKDKTGRYLEKGQPIIDLLEAARIKAFKQELGTIFNKEDLTNILFQLYNDGQPITKETAKGIKDAVRRKGFKAELGNIFDEQALKDILFDYYNDGHPIDPKIQAEAYQRKQREAEETVTKAMSTAPTGQADHPSNPLAGFTGLPDAPITVRAAAEGEREGSVTKRLNIANINSLLEQDGKEKTCEDIAYDEATGGYKIIFSKGEGADFLKQALERLRIMKDVKTSPDSPQSSVIVSYHEFRALSNSIPQEIKAHNYESVTRTPVDISSIARTVELDPNSPVTNKTSVSVPRMDGLEKASDALVSSLMPPSTSPTRTAPTSSPAPMHPTGVDQVVQDAALSAVRGVGGHVVAAGSEPHGPKDFPSPSSRRGSMSSRSSSGHGKQ